MARTALITGASSGLGAEYARQLAARGMNLVLVGRSRTALDAVATELRGSGVDVEILRADLVDQADLARVADRLRTTDHPVDLLINNAGLGLPLEFADNDIQREIDHLHLHVEAPMVLMHAALQQMRTRGGKILNVASVAAYIPRSTYSACKAWLINFSRWANNNYDNVTVTAVAPGYTHTNFHERMGLEPGNEGVAGWMWLTAPRVVSESLRDLARGKSVSVPSLRYKVLTKVASVVPDSVLSRMGRAGR